MAVPIVKTSLSSYAAGTEANPVLHPTGFQVTMGFVEYLAAQGYCFVGEGAFGEFIQSETGADNQDIALDEPSFYMEIPGGITVIPLYVAVCFEEGTGTDNILALVTGSNAVGNLAVTGGGTVSVNNLRTDNPRASVVACDIQDESAATGELTAVLTTPRVLWIWSSPSDMETLAPRANPEFKPAHLTAIVGPGCLAFYSHGITTPAQFRMTMYWAEVPSGLLTQTI